MSGRDKLWRTLCHAADDGYVDTNVTLLVAWSGLSRPTIFRALEQLTRERLIETEAKYGPGGGLRISLKSVSKSVSNQSQKSHVRNAFQNPVQGTSSPEPEPDSVRETVSNQSHDDDEPAWFVCCIWYDDKGNLWAHGDDGIPMYQPCASKEEAMELAERHSQTPHRDRSQRYGVLPRSDVCERHAKGKALHYSYGSLNPMSDLTEGPLQDAVAKLRAKAREPRSNG